MILTVDQIAFDDRYQDVVRLHKRYRGPIRVGQICVLSTPYRKVLVELRGAPKESVELTIYMDQYTRQKLGIVIGTIEDFKLKPAGIWRQFIWAAKATNPALAIAAKLGLLSFILGALSVVLAIAPLVPWSNLSQLVSRLFGE